MRAESELVSECKFYNLDVGDGLNLTGAQRWNDKPPDVIREANRARRINGLSEIVSKIRACLKCDRRFKSHSNSNRLCQTCQETNARNE